MPHLKNSNCPDTNIKRKTATASRHFSVNTFINYFRLKSKIIKNAKNDVFTYFLVMKKAKAVERGKGGGQPSGREEVKQNM